ncbi:endonuclease domain-containing protein [Streptomyces sp. NPDC003877]
MPKPVDRRSTDVTARDPLGRKFCPYCNQWKVADAFYRQPSTRDGFAHNCRDCHRGAKLIREYGITLARYEEMLLQQAGGCRICGKTNPNGDRLSVDHDHACCPGRRSCGACVRGLLCHACNQGIGKFVDNPALLRAAAAYLERRDG